MNSPAKIKEELLWFRSKVDAWNKPVTADIDLYDFMGLSLDTLEALDWLKRSIRNGEPLSVSVSPEDAIMDFADFFFERFHGIFQSIMLSGRNHREEVADALSPFIAKLCEVSENGEAIMRIASSKQKERLEIIRQQI